MENKKNVKKFRCLNFGICPKADSQEIIEIDALEALGGTPECPHCHQLTLEEVVENKKPKGLIIGAIGGVAAIAAVAGFLIFGNGSEEKKADPTDKKPGTEKVEDNNGKTDSTAIITDKPEGGETETVTQPAPETGQGEKTKPAGETGTKPGGQPQTRQPQTGHGTVNLGYGSYTGDLKNGQPHGYGKITYTQSHKIVNSKDFVANPGDTFEGDFREGRISGIGYWTHDGNQTAVKP